MNILGIESSAHTFGVGIVNEKGKVLANALDSYKSEEAGMIPDKVAEHHQKIAEKVLQQALAEAKLDWKNIEFIAYSAGPGLDPSLWVGYNKAKEWSKKYKKKIIGVNHPAAHLSIGKVLHKLKDPCYLYVSGVNTQIIVANKNKYTILGETFDIGLGNMLDKFGRTIGLGFPAGQKIEELAKKGKYVELPYVVKGMDVSFSGILTKIQQLFERKVSKNEAMIKEGKSIDLPYTTDKNHYKILERMQKDLDKPISKEDLCFSVQETCFAMLAEVAERAMTHMEKKELLLVGGVGANNRFCEMLDIMCKERDAKFYKVPPELVKDNGAMIAWEGYIRRNESKDIGIKPHWRIDKV